MRGRRPSLLAGRPGLRGCGVSGVVARVWVVWEVPRGEKPTRSHLFGFFTSEVEARQQYGADDPNTEAVVEWFPLAGDLANLWRRGEDGTFGPPTNTCSLYTARKWSPLSDVPEDPHCVNCGGAPEAHPGGQGGLE